jgi:hypothetical protein
LFFVFFPTHLLVSFFFYSFLSSVIISEGSKHIYIICLYTYLFERLLFLFCLFSSRRRGPIINKDVGLRIQSLHKLFSLSLISAQRYSSGDRRLFPTAPLFPNIYSIYLHVSEMTNNSSTNFRPFIS